MRQHLKFREHGLAEQSRAEFLDIVVDEVFAHRFVGLFVQQIAHQQRFIDRGGDFGCEDRVVTVGKRLRFACIVGVHGVSHFVHDRENIFERVRIVEQDIRLTVVGTEAVSAAGLALVFVDVDPAVLGAAVYLREIFFAERRESCLHHLQSLFIWDIFFWQLYQRNVHVIHLQFLDAEHFFAQLDILVQHRQILMHDRDQVVIDLFRDVAGGKRGLPGRVVFADARGDNVVFDIIVIGSRDRVDMRLVRFIHIGKRSLAQIAVMAFHEGDVVSVRKVYRISILVNHGAERQIRVVEHLEDVIGRAGHFTELGEDVFFGSAEHMLLFTQRVLQSVAVLRELRLGVNIAADGLFRSGEQLRREE